MSVNCICIFQVSHSRKRTSLRQSILCGFDNVIFLWWGVGCLICLIVLVVKLLTGFEAFDPPVKEFVLGVSVVILD